MTDLQKTMFNFIKTIECQRFITGQSIKQFVKSRVSSKYTNRNLNNIWNSCNQHFRNGIYLYLHRYQKLVKNRFSNDIDLKYISVIENNTDKVYELFTQSLDKRAFMDRYIELALSGELDKLVKYD